MKPKVVSFDCAQTLLEVDWSMRRYIADVCAHMELEIPLEGASIYEDMYHTRQNEFLTVNQTRNQEECERWWIRLGEDWLRAIGKDPGLAPQLQTVSDEVGFGPNSILFRVYDDVIPTLENLAEMGIRVAVLSNWDHSLHKALRGQGIYDRFELVIASLEEGFEKPDPRMFERVTEFFGVKADEVMHVGDNPIDDFEGATQFGMRAVLIDRGRQELLEPWINDLSHLPGAFSWNG